MSRMRSALLLVGSPRSGGGASEVLGSLALNRLAGLGAATRVVRIHQALRRMDDTDRMLEAVEQHQLLILSFPVYLDALPAETTRALQMIAARRKAGSLPVCLAAIANCGYPEAQHTEVALAVCRQFARESGLTWLGGLGMAMGGAVAETLRGGQPGLLAPARQALVLAAGAWARGQPAPPEAREMIARPMMPDWLYRMAANIGWKQAAVENQAAHPLHHRPYPRKKRAGGANS